MKPINYLIPGRIVKYKNGTYAIFVSNYYNYGACFLSKTGCVLLSSYNSNLMQVESKLDGWSIVAIYETPKGIGLDKQLEDNNKTVIWKRECLELTLEDIAKKFNVQSVKIINK